MTAADVSAELVARVWGQDVPGISSAFVDLVVGHSCELIDQTQFLLGDTLMFTFSLRASGEGANTVLLMKDLTRCARERGLQIDFHAPDCKMEGAEAVESAENVAVLSVVSAMQITPALMYDLDTALTAHSCTVLNIEHRSDNKKESNGEFNKLQLLIGCPPDVKLSALLIGPPGTLTGSDSSSSLQEAAWRHGAEVTVRWYNALSRPIGKSLVVFGLSHVLYPNDVMDEVLREAGEDPSTLSLSGSIPEQCKQKSQLLKGKDSKIEQQVIDRLEFTPGAFLVCSAFKRLGFRLAVLTNTGLRGIAEHVKRQLGIDYVISRDLAVDDDGTFTGEYVDEVSDVSFRKMDLLKLMADRDGISDRNVIVIGEFLKGLKAANARMLLETFGPNVFFNTTKRIQDLSAALYLLGFNGADVRDLRQGARTTSKMPVGVEDGKFPDDHVKKHVILQVSSLSREPGQISRILAPVRTLPDIELVTVRQCNLQHGGACFGFDLHVGNDSEQVAKELLFSCQRNGFQIHEIGERASLSSRPCWLHPGHRRHIVTLVQHPRIRGTTMQAVLKSFSEKAVNIFKKERLSVQGLAALNLSVDIPHGLAIEAFADELLEISRKHGADISFQKDDLHRSMRRVVIFDMDSTLIEGEVIDELAKIAGVEEQVSTITQAAMRGEINFFESLQQRVALLKGHNAEELFGKVKKDLRYSPGAERLCGTLKSLGYKMAVISGGFLPVARDVQRHLGLDYAFANSLEVDENTGLLTGKTTGPVVTPQRKRALLGTIANVEGCEVRQTIAVGDGANDIPMLTTAGLGIAFCAKPRVQEVAEFRVNQKDLSTILYLIGVSEHAADRLNSESGPGTPRPNACLSGAAAGYPQ